MEIKKETTVIPMTTDGKALNSGDTVAFNADGRCLVGKFCGISKRGAVMFEGIISDCKVMFNVMPRSITSIYLADVSMKCEVHE